ncbi:small heat shock protein [Forsythia ovata]|uniref:Small heat shock protein n=1 Tax=Forsythia ovata TaxID=205694 RepID=A0ABD1SNX7_9LAMI
MATKFLTCASSSLASNNVVRTNCSVFFPSACNVRRSSSVRTQATGNDKDTMVDVHQVSSNNQRAAVQSRPGVWLWTSLLSVSLSSPNGTMSLFLSIFLLQSFSQSNN